MYGSQAFARRTLMAGVFLAATQALAGAPEALDRRLQDLSAAAGASDRVAQQQMQDLMRLVADPKGRVLVMVRMAHPSGADDTVAALRGLGFVVSTHSDLDRRLVTGFLPVERLRQAQALPAVSAVMAVSRPVRTPDHRGKFKAGPPVAAANNPEAGAARSKAIEIHRADLVQAMGIDGRGIRVGVLSDSFDRCGPPDCITTAADDIRTGDLPAEGVTVVQEGPAGLGADEGRAMLQLVHDIAPGAALAFAAATDDPLGFARNVLALRTRFKADVIVDDIAFTEEPMLSDGVITRAIDWVVQDGGAYFSAVGNSGFQGDEGQFQAVPFSEALALSAQGDLPVKLEQIPAALRPRAVHGFGVRLDGERPRLTQRFRSEQGFIGAFQWDEPFDRGAVQTEYEMYFFDDKGNWLDPRKGATGLYYYTMQDSRAYDRPVEQFGFALEREVYLVIGKRNDGPANRFKYVMNGIGGVEGGGSGTAFGHVAARNTFSVGGTEQVLPFENSNANSVGPYTVYLDAKGQRLVRPEVRQAPRALAVQGCDNTFFGFDVDGTGFPNFFGSSASAPVAAGIAALTLQAAGGPGRMPAKQLYDVLERTSTLIPVPDDANVGVAKAGPLTLTARGQLTSGRDYFQVELAPGAPSVRTLSLDLSPTTIAFGPTQFSLLGDRRGVQPSDITRTVSRDAKVIRAAFKPGAFKAGEAFQFGWIAADTRFGGGPLFVLPFEMQGAVLTATLSDGSTHRGILRSGVANPVVSRFTGYGLLDALSAVEAARSTR